VKIECAMQNELIDDLAIDHSPTPLPQQKRIQTLNAKETKSSSKIDLRDVLWWMSNKEACKLGVPIIAKFSKERYISLAAKGKPSHPKCKHD
jgi:hypothetical protein